MKRRLSIVFFFAILVVPTLTLAQVPPRFYWKTLVGSHGVPLLFLSPGGNASPLDPAHVVSADVEFDAEILLAGYARILSVFDRSALVAVLQPMGRIGAQARFGSLGSFANTSGYGDPTLEFTINVLGPPPIKNIPDLLRYEPGFSLDLLVDLVVPIGEYDNDEALNLGQNRWYGRFGAPIVWQLGPWIPGRRTTAEFLPSVWLYGDNDDLQGSTLKTDPMVQIEGHLTRDFTETFWGSLDANWMTGGKSTVDGQAGESIDSLKIGFSVGTPLTEHLQLTIAYAASVNDSAPDDLRMDGFQVSLIYGWHKLIEAMGRLNGGE
jgi:hypothetical protein